ncbi:MAG: hypothetical protein OQK35_07195 [Alphaproteobacteria bacterium]|nr:hypothetical protein [Rhodospirillales bacterium]MCW9046105.1 hypothetical protein [Alphaproteobacteria bacterium]
MTSTELANFTSKVERVSSLVNAAKRLLDEGQSIELSALTGHVEELCRYVQENPAEDNIPHKISLTAIMESLDELENKMVEQHQEFSEIHEFSTRSRAMEAYGKTEEDKPKKGE